MTTLVCLHGFSQNGAAMRAHMLPLLPRLPATLDLDFPDAPHTCSEASVERLQRFVNAARMPAPHLCFWDSTDDGRVYRGFEQTHALFAQRLAGLSRIGLLGFSQGAIAATALCALSVRGELPKIDFAVLVSGRAPRSDLLRPLLTPPIAIPSLHVWGERDAFAMSESPTLLACYAEAQQQVVTWPGPHLLPTRGPAADAIVAFVQQQVQ